MAPKRQPPHYQGEIKMVDLTIENLERDAFRAKLEELPFLGYRVERLTDGRCICITKPGGKNVFGQMRIHDFMVWIYDEQKKDRWRISHEEIKQDLQTKINTDSSNGLIVVKALMRVYKGEEPDDVLKTLPEVNNLPGQSPELLLKVYKWIWGQEDCNYPTGEGRYMSMKGIEEISGMKVEDLVSEHPAGELRGEGIEEISGMKVEDLDGEN